MPAVEISKRVVLMVSTLMLLTLSENQSHAADCNYKKFQAIGTDPGIPKSEYVKPGGWKKAQETGKEATKDGIKRWQIELQRDSNNYDLSWSRAKDKFIACDFESEEVYDSGHEWGWVKCRVTAKACRLNTATSTSPPKKDKARCPANDVKCRANQLQYKSKKLFVPPLGPKREVIKLQ